MKAKPVMRALFLIFLWSVPGFAQEAPDFSGQDETPERRPVVLVPGWMGRALDMMALKERLVRDGWPEAIVFPLEFTDPVGSNVDHADELDLALQSILEETGALQVDVVAHSMGGLAVWVLLQETSGLVPIKRVVFLATPFQGTVTAHLAWGAGGPEMIPESSFLRGLAGGGWPQRWVDALTIRTPLDLTVLPAFGTDMLGLGDRLICCPTHQGLLDHEETYAIIRDFLLEGKRSEDDSTSR